MTDTTYCQACGAELHPDASVCPECGVEPPGRDGSGNVALFAALLSAAIGALAFAIVFGPIAAVSGFYAYRRQDGLLRWLAAIACAVGVVWALIGAWFMFRLYSMGMAV